jgi:selenoprotein W-related protein
MSIYPRVSIEFCTKCRWNFRAVWYLQELLSTFGNDLGEVALIPRSDGIFIVKLAVSENTQDIVLWNRKERGGFPGE